jgi:hypothetical protein
LAHWWDGAVKITEQALKGHLIGIVIFPLAKVSNIQIFRSIPAANIFALQIGIEPLGELLG